MLSKNTETFIGCGSDFSESDIVLFGAPFDGTASFRPGTRFAPKIIRGDSYGIETYSPYQNADLTQFSICDSGDLEFPFGNTQKVLSQIEERTDIILNSGKIPVMIGGEHLVTLGAVRAAYKKYPELNIIHFDAHTDLRDEYLGENLSHSTVIRRAWDILGDDKIYQFGIRSGEKHEFQFAHDHTKMCRYNLNTFDDTVNLLKGKPVYFTLDLDILDPSIFPGTGTPEAGGISFMCLLEAVIKLKQLNIVGCDINELSPVYDQSGVSTAVACKILRELLIAVGGNFINE